MSDWEDEYDEDGVAIDKPITDSAPMEREQTFDDRRQGRVCFGVRNESTFGGSRGRTADGGAGIFESGRRSEHGDVPLNRDGEGRRILGNGEQDSSSSEVIPVEMSMIGRIIGLFVY